MAYSPQTFTAGLGLVQRASFALVAPLLALSALACSSRDLPGGGAGGSSPTASGGASSGSGGRVTAGGSFNASGGSADAAGRGGGFSNGGASNGGSGESGGNSSNAGGSSGASAGGSSANAGSSGERGGSGGSNGNDTIDTRAMVKALGFGTNIGNTLENTATWETGWSQPLITQAFINGLASRGIKTVRVPVAWDTYATNGTIDPTKMARVKQVVNWIIGAGMYAIVNIHWDGGWIDNEKGSPPYTLTTEIKSKFVNYWKQIGTAFSDVGHKLILEGMNEEGRWTTDSQPYGPANIPPLNEMNSLVRQHRARARRVQRDTCAVNRRLQHGHRKDLRARVHGSDRPRRRG